MPLRSHFRSKKIKRGLAHAMRVMGPTLVALTFAGVAHAQGTMDFSGAQTLMGSFNTRLAYVAISRASEDARIYTNNAETLAERLATDISKSSALDFQQSSSTVDMQQAVATPRGNDPASGPAVAIPQTGMPSRIESIPAPAIELEEFGISLRR